MDGTEKLGEEDYAFFDGFKIVVFGWDRFGWDEEVYYGNTPVEVVRCTVSYTHLRAHET